MSQMDLNLSGPHIIPREDSYGVDRPHTRSNSDNSLQHSTSLIEVIPQGIDVEEEARLYEDLCDVSTLLLSILFALTLL